MEVRWEPVTRPSKAQAPGVKRQGFDMTRMGIVAFVAVHVHLQAALGGNFAQGFYGSCTLGHGSFKMGNASHDVNAQVQCALQVGGTGAVAIVAILGKATSCKSI